MRKTIDVKLEEALDILVHAPRFDRDEEVGDALEWALIVIKEIFGELPSEAQLQAALEAVVIVEQEYPNPAKIELKEFCPRCGCHWSQRTGNLSQYPEHYEKWYCLRCNFLVAMIDNSPRTHALEWKDDDYVIEA